MGLRSLVAFLPESRHITKRVYSSTDSDSRKPAALDRLSQNKLKLNAREFHESLWTIPNILTMSRLVAAPAIGYLVLHSNHGWAASIFTYACVTDFVDGWIARKFNLQSVVGSVLDPMADKILMVTLTGCLSWIGSLPVWIAVIIFGRDFLLGLSAIYYRYISLPPPKTMQRYWDFSIPSAEVHPTTISKYNTALQMALLGATLLKPLALAQMEPATQALALQAIGGLEYTVAITTILSGISYVFSTTAVKILTPEEIAARHSVHLSAPKEASDASDKMN
ncbi:CDP-alcohol phosphatidyltransferase-domain-containing protein [Limtongia smithiae]|uniref:CDP-alcohol phosphatidyltransferase-domain-containing protein n=1 Tax=Limtongia smithiae TaxID=1125753 RepID=UPI0034CE6CE2